MEITLTRTTIGDGYVKGRLQIEDQYTCNTLEPSAFAKHPCIPTGRYKVTMYPSAKFKGERPILWNVPGRKGILIHEGNTRHDTQGCILVGRDLAPSTLSYSRNTLAEVMYYIKQAKDTVWITIK